MTPSRRISVIICTHNRESLLRLAIASVLDQSRRPDEIIVADDGATLPRSFALTGAGGMPITLLPLPRLGMARTRNAGFAASTGDLLLFLDDDDELAPGAIATLERAIAPQSGAVAAVGCATVIDQFGDPVDVPPLPPLEDLGRQLWHGNRIRNAGCALIARSAFETVGGWDDVPNAGDFLLWLKLSRIGGIVGVPDLVLRYRTHPDNETSHGNQFVNLVEFRRGFRASFPDLVRTPTEQRVLASLIRNHADDAWMVTAGMLRRGEWRRARRRLIRMARVTAMAWSGGATRVAWRQSARQVAGRIIRRWQLDRLLRRLRRHPMSTVADDRTMRQLIMLWNNTDWSASLALLRRAAAGADTGAGDILECGAGLSTLVIGAVAAARRRRVVSLEHDRRWAKRMEIELRRMGVDVEVVFAPLGPRDTYDWYDTRELSGRFALVVCDGPPGSTRGGRSGLLPEVWQALAPGALILLDDADRPGEQSTLAQWSANYPVDVRIEPDQTFATIALRDRISG